MNFDIVRAWKDDEYRLSLSDEERRSLPANPVGEIELTDADLELVYVVAVGTMVVTVTIVTTTVTYVVAYVSASNATASSVVSLSFARSATSMKLRAGAANTGANNFGLRSTTRTSVFSLQICTSDFHCRGKLTSTVEIFLLSEFRQAS